MGASKKRILTGKLLLISAMFVLLLVCWIGREKPDNTKPTPTITQGEFYGMLSSMTGFGALRQASCFECKLNKAEMKRIILQALAASGQNAVAASPVLMPSKQGIPSEREQILNGLLDQFQNDRLVSKNGAIRVLDKLFNNKIVYTALGDSLALGVGDLQGKGYVGRFNSFLERSDNRPVITRNFGIRGLNSSELLESIRKDQRVRQAIRESTLLSLNIGGNDLLEAARAKKPTRALEQNLSRFRSNWNAILNEIRNLNPNAQLVVLDIYNPFPKNHPYRYPADWWVSRYNDVIQSSSRKLAGSDPFFLGQASLQEIFDGHEAEYISRKDGVHPSSQGHQMIANILIQLYQSF